MALARLSGLALLNIPDPTNTPSTPSCISRETSAGVAGGRGEGEEGGEREEGEYETFFSKKSRPVNEWFPYKGHQITYKQKVLQSINNENDFQVHKNTASQVSLY